MKKLYTLLFSLLAVFSLHAETLEWNVSDLGWTKSNNNTLLDKETINFNDLSLSLSDGEATEGSEIIYKHTQSDDNPYINFYSKNTITISVTGATINQITIKVDDDSTNPKTSKTTESWRVKIGNVRYEKGNNIWNGEAKEIVLTGDSKTALLGFIIEYTPDSTNETGPENPGGVESDGEEKNIIWNVTELTDLKNNDQLDGNSFDINSNLSFSLSNGEATSQFVRFVTTNDKTYIQIYSKNSITFKSKDANITSIKFIVDNGTAGWSLQTPGPTGQLETYNNENDTWTGNTTEITFTSKSNTFLTGVEITYEVFDDGSEDPEQPGNGEGEDGGEGDGEEKNITWNVTELTDLKNNDQLDGNSFDINSNLSFSLSNGEATSQFVRFVTTNDKTYIQIYSKNSITFKSKDANITSIKFIVDNGTAGWSLQTPGPTGQLETYNNENDTWTGNTTEITFTSKSNTFLTGVEITYEVFDDGSEEPENPGGDDDNAGLFFTVDMIGDGEDVADITLSYEDVSINFTTTSASAHIDKRAAYFGTADDYTTYDYRYRPGSKSENPNSAIKGTITVPADGTLYIYVAPGSETDTRKLVILQDEEIVFKKGIDPNVYETPSGTELKVYPIRKVGLKKGTAYITWPDNQVFFYGFKFVAGEITEPDVDPDPEPEPEDSGLFFTESMVGNGEKVADVTLSYEDVSINFTTTSTSASIDKRTAYFGTADDYTTYDYRYRPGSKSENPNSATKGTITVPADGTLYIYVAPGSETDTRKLVILQDEEIVFKKGIDPNVYETPSGTELKVYPIRKVGLKKGTAYLTWPDNQVFFYGFKFVAGEITEPDVDPDLEPEPEDSGLFFTVDMTGSGEDVADVTLSYEDVSINFTTTSTSASIDKRTAYFGTADDYTTYDYRYRPGSKSENPNSATKGTITVPADGTLYIYVAPGSETDTRKLVIIQDEEIVFKKGIDPNVYETPSGTELKVYPIRKVGLKKGTAYLTWPDNQVFFYGFKFVPGEVTEPDVDPDPEPEPEDSGLFFTESMVGNGEKVADVTLSYEDVSINFTTTSTSASIDKRTAYFGTADDYTTYDYRYRSGSKSADQNADIKGTITVPEDGTLYIYVAPGSETDTRKLVIIQDEEIVFKKGIDPNVYETPSGTELKVYPIRKVGLKKGTAYLTWPDNQVFFYGFKFVPGEITEPDVDPDPEPEPEDGGLFFTESMVGNGEKVADVTLSYEDVSINFTTTSTSASIDKRTAYFGTADDYTTYDYRYRPGSKSENPNSATKGTITVPADGTLYIYVAPGSETDTRNLVVTQNDVEVFNQGIDPNDFVTPTGTELKVYPVRKVGLKKGTAYLTWPKNQVFFYGFKFVPGEVTEPENPGSSDDNGGNNGDDDESNVIGLFFTENQVSSGEGAQKITLEEDGVVISFQTTSASAKLLAGNGYFGTAQEWETLGYKYQPNGTSTNGTSSTAMATCTFPSNGKLTIYVYSGTDAPRNIQIVQNDVNIFQKGLSNSDAMTPEGRNISVWPVYTVDVKKGTAYILWPDGGITFYGFKFEPTEGSGEVTDPENPGDGDDNGDDDNGDDKEDEENNNPEQPENPDDDNDPTDQGEGGIFFSEDLISSGVDPQDFSITDKKTGFSVHFISDENATIDTQKVYFGTPDDYMPLESRYRPGAYSSNGIDSNAMGIFTFPERGILSIYAYNNNAVFSPSLVLLDENEFEVWSNSFDVNEFSRVPGKSTKVYPVYEIEVSKGTGYLLWPDGQVILCGFNFEPVAVAPDGTTGLDQFYEERNDGKAYDLLGRPVNDSYKGIVIINGKKVLRR